MGTGTGDEVDTQDEKEDKEVVDDFVSQVRLNSLTHENKASTNMETGHSDQFGMVRNINKVIDGLR